VRGGDLAERKLASRPGIGEDDVEGSALGLHRRVESVPFNGCDQEVWYTFKIKLFT
jgi:hypothetical protein